MSVSFLLPQHFFFECSHSLDFLRNLVLQPLILLISFPQLTFYLGASSSITLFMPFQLLLESAHSLHFLLQTAIELLKQTLPLRFYAVMIKPREKENQDSNKKLNQEEPAVQVWVVRFESNETGRIAESTLQAMMDEGLLETLMEAEYREDRAPRGSMVRALEEALGKSALTGLKE